MSQGKAYFHLQIWNPSSFTVGVPWSFPKWLLGSLTLGTLSSLSVESQAHPWPVMKSSQELKSSSKSFSGILAVLSSSQGTGHTVSWGWRHEPLSSQTSAAGAHPTHKQDLSRNLRSVELEEQPWAWSHPRAAAGCWAPPRPRNRPWEPSANEEADWSYFNILWITKWALGLTAHNLKRKFDTIHSFSRESLATVGKLEPWNVHVKPKQQGRHSGQLPSQHNEHLYSHGEGISGQRSHPKENSTNVLVYSREKPSFFLSLQPLPPTAVLVKRL